MGHRGAQGEIIRLEFLSVALPVAKNFLRAFGISAVNLL
jgi:hypothetical protein